MSYLHLIIAGERSIETQMRTEFGPAEPVHLRFRDAPVRCARRKFRLARAAIPAPEHTMVTQQSETADSADRGTSPLKRVEPAFAPRGVLIGKDRRQLPREIGPVALDGTEPTAREPSGVVLWKVPAHRRWAWEAYQAAILPRERASGATPVASARRRGPRC